jgi:hypothetical protein
VPKFKPPFPTAMGNGDSDFGEIFISATIYKANEGRKEERKKIRKKNKKED